MTSPTPHPDAPDDGATAHQRTALNALRAFLVDLDGVIYTGNTAIDGAAAFLRYLNETGRKFQCITNNSTQTAAQFAAKLAAMGMPVTPDQVLTSSQATATYLRTRLGTGARIMAIGEEGLVRALMECGLKLALRSPDAVVVGLDRRLTYERLTAACFAVRAGVPFIATNPDLSLPTEQGFLPGNGAALASIQAATGVAPVVIGKPEAAMLEIAMGRLGTSRDETAIIGDGLHTDVLAGRRAGVTPILVLTGVSRRHDVAPSLHQPDYVFDNLPAVQRAMLGR
ncbi:MAG: HAD-IIA family hydrolase [Chloroflexi bacterium]|nr:HAD-IIA family hydrolase [Chloroflexota bacterium]